MAVKSSSDLLGGEQRVFPFLDSSSEFATFFPELGQLHFASPCKVDPYAGTMQFGEALDYSEAEKLFICAADLGISVFDSAEMYPVPQRATTQGRAEEFLGVWLQRQDR